MTLEWKEPPAVPARRTPTDDALKELQSQPNRWALVRTYKDQASAKVAVSSTWRRRAKLVEDADYEFVAAEGSVYGRFIYVDASTEAVNENEPALG